MFNKISVLIPTRNRVERLQRMLASYERTYRVGTSELVFRIDDDDRETQEFLSDTAHRLVIGPRLQGYDSMPLFFNEMLAVSTGDVLMCGNDDMLFKSDAWAPRLLEEASRYPDGLFNLGVSTLNEDHYPFCIVSKHAASRMGFIWDPRIFWGDIFLRDVMAFFGRCVMVPDVQIEHDWAGYAPDLVFMQADKDIVARNPSYWSVTHAQAVNQAIDVLKVAV